LILFIFIIFYYFLLFGTKHTGGVCAKWDHSMYFLGC